METTEKLMQLRRQLMFLNCLMKKNQFFVALESSDYRELKAFIESKPRIVITDIDGMRPDCEHFNYDGIFVCEYPIARGQPFGFSSLFDMLGDNMLPMAVGENIREPFTELARVATRWNYMHGAKA